MTDQPPTVARLHALGYPLVEYNVTAARTKLLTARGAMFATDAWLDDLTDELVLELLPLPSAVQVQAARDDTVAAIRAALEGAT